MMLALSLGMLPDDQDAEEVRYAAYMALAGFAFAGAGTRRLILRGALRGLWGRRPQGWAVRLR
jgi:hypothetical protein